MIFLKQNTQLKNDNIVIFTQKSGLLDILCQMESATDYLLGVEVGLDTNARKNRSGLFLEKLVTEKVREMTMLNPGMLFFEQKTFGYIEKNYHIHIPPSLKNRKFDYTVINKDKATNIEVNYYGGTGSKPSEIVSSYINRGQILKTAGWKFVWLTDGPGWKKMKKPFYIGVENIDYVITSRLLGNSVLEKLILDD